MKKFTLPALFLFFVSGSVFAAIDIKGNEFNEKILSNTLILSNKDDVIKLTVNCKASSNKYGDGKWTWSNGGFFINFKNKKFVFGRQEVALNDIGKCRD